MKNSSKTAEDYRVAVLSLKETYKQLAKQHLSLQDDVKQKELQQSAIKRINIFELTNNAIWMEKNAKKLQALVRGGIWRQTVKQLRVKKLMDEQATISQQEKYLRYVRQQADSYEFKASVKDLEAKIDSESGINLQMVFRFLDINSQNQILTQDFKNALFKLASKTTFKSSYPMEAIEMIVKGFDRNECGYISKEKYNQILLEIGSGKLSEKSDMVQQYFNSALGKVVEMMDSQQIRAQKLFETLAIMEGNFMSSFNFFNWTTSSSEDGLFKLTQDEKTALIIVFNLNYSIFIKKNQFLTKILPLQRVQDKSINLSNKGAVVDYSSQESVNQNLSNQNISKLSQSKFSVSLSEAKKQGDNYQNKQNIQMILNKLFSKVPLHVFLEKVLYSYTLDKSSLSMDDISNLLDTYVNNSSVTLKEKGQLFMAMDADGNGMLEMNELIDFFVGVSDNIQLSLQTFLIMQAKLLEMQRISTLNYFKGMGLDITQPPTSEDMNITGVPIYTKNGFVDILLDIQLFHDTIGAALGLDENSITRLFMEIQNAKTSTVSTRELIQIMEGYRSDTLEKAVRRQEDNRVDDKIQLLDKFKLDLELKGHLTLEKLWSMTDVNSKGFLSLYELKCTIQKVLPSMPSSKIISMLSYIDLNENGIIDQEEFHLAFLSKETELIAKIKRKQTEPGSNALKSRQVSNFNSPKMSKSPSIILSTIDINTKEEKEIISKFKDLILHRGMTPLKFFEMADADRSGQISLIEMKNALTNLQMDLQSILKIMKVFDKNENGQVDYQEFISVVGDDLKPSTAMIGGRKITGMMAIDQIDQQIDTRALMDVKDRLDEYGPQQENELKDALSALGKLVIDKMNLNKQSKQAVYQELFKQFDSDSNRELSRAEFIKGLDSLNHQLNLTDRQKIRLAISADKNKDDIIDLKEFMEFLEQTHLKLEIQEKKLNRIRTKVSKMSDVKDKNIGGFQVNEEEKEVIIKEDMQQYLYDQLLSAVESKQLQQSNVMNNNSGISIQQQLLSASTIQLQSISENILRDAYNLHTNNESSITLDQLKEIIVKSTSPLSLNAYEIEIIIQEYLNKFKDIVLWLPEYQQKKLNSQLSSRIHTQQKI